MKKQISILLSLLVAFSSLFVSCSENDDDLKTCKITVKSDGGGRVSISNYVDTSEDILIGSSVEVVATPDAGYSFVGWFSGDNETPVSTDEKFVFIASKNTTLRAQFKKSSDAGDDNGSGDTGSDATDNHEYVDLGLSVKWATCNVGATDPWEYGDYFAWGETEEKEYYGWETYKWCNGSYDTMTKYCTDSDNGIVDNKMTLELEDDVAHVKWGGDWRMPTLEEQKELLDNCTWEWTSLNGVNGYRVTSKTNGNSIFLPAAGYRDGTGVSYRGNRGYYWSSSLYSYYSYFACSLYFNDGHYYWNGYYRCYGLSVRPVCE